jgi:menaquinone-dependent protoporphyrinogen oxidase
MTILVAYASKHGSTQGIAERIAERLRQLGKEAEDRSYDEDEE